MLADRISRLFRKLRRSYSDAWARWLGAYQALNLDGGGSTTLVSSDGKGGARLLNRPIHAGIPGRERIVANHLGVYAQERASPPGR